MKTAKAIVAKVLGIGLVAGTVMLAAPSVAQAQAFGRPVAHPVYGFGPDFYGHDRWERERIEREREEARRRAEFERRERMEHHFFDRDRHDFDHRNWR